MARGVYARVRTPGAAPGNNYVVGWSICAAHRRPARLPFLSISPPGAILRPLGRSIAADRTE